MSNGGNARPGLNRPPAGPVSFMAALRLGAYRALASRSSRPLSTIAGEQESTSGREESHDPSKRAQRFDCGVIISSHRGVESSSI